MFGHFLALQGFRVSLAANGRDGVQKAVTLQPDVVLMDLRLPELSGTQAVDTLRQDARTRSIPVVVITAYSPLLLDMTDCAAMLTKPCPPDRLLEAILAALKTRELSNSRG